MRSKMSLDLKFWLSQGEIVAPDPSPSSSWPIERSLFENFWKPFGCNLLFRDEFMMCTNDPEAGMMNWTVKVFLSSPKFQKFWFFRLFRLFVDFVDVFKKNEKICFVFFKKIFFSTILFSTSHKICKSVRNRKKYGVTSLPDATKTIVFIWITKIVFGVRLVFRCDSRCLALASSV